MKTDSTYSLGPDRLKDALDILDKELGMLRAYAETARESKTSKLAAYIFLASVAVIGGLWNHDRISFGTAWKVAVFILIPFYVLVFLYGYRGVRAFRQLRRAQRDLGLQAIEWFVGWKEFKARLPLVLLAELGTIVLVFSFFLRESSRWFLDGGLVVFITCMLVSNRWLVRRAKRVLQDKIDEAERLRSIISEHQSLAGGGADLLASIPEADYKQIARIERALVARDRRQAIKKSSGKRAGDVWAVQASASVLKKRSGLEPAARLMVQTQMDELTADPTPDTARQDAEGVWHVPVPQTPWEILYTLEEDSKYVMVRDLLDGA